MNLFIDSTAQIQDGEKDVTEQFPSSWYELWRDNYMSQVLKEYIYI